MFVARTSGKRRPAGNWRLLRRPAICAVAIAAACALAALSGRADAEEVATAIVPAALETPEAPPVAAAPIPPFSEIRNRIESSGGLVAAGERLHGELLRQFYAAHNYEPVWPQRQAQAQALLAAVLRAGEHGLDPELFHAAVLRNPAALSLIDRDLLLSDAFLAFGDALARGALPVEQRMDDEDLTPEPVDVAARLDQAINSPDPAAVIAALAPHSPEYLALQRALQSYRAAAAAGEADHRAIAGLRGRQSRQPADPPAPAREARVHSLEVNLERLRWLPRELPPDRVWVNLPDARLVLYRNGRPVFSTRVVIGQVDKQTPELRSTISSLLFNPPWNVPRSIASKEILPRLSQDPGYLARHHMVWRRNGAIQQLPGASAALGQIKFEMPNRFDVYLHDTPMKALFSRDNRRQSHGCVRVQNPRELAALLLQQPEAAVERGIGLGYTNRRNLPSEVPVFLVYQTAFIDSDGTLAFRPDVYDRDREIWEHLHPTRQAPIAQHEVGARRG